MRGKNTRKTNLSYHKKRINLWSVLINRFAAVILALALISSAMPVNVRAEGSNEGGPKDTDYVKYYYDSQNKYRTGYKLIYLDPYTYYDATANSAETMDLAFLKGITDKYLLKQWAPLADSIFSTQDKAANYIGNSDYKKHFQADSPSDGYFNVKNVLSTSASTQGGKWKNGNGYKSSDLQTAGTLKEVRKAMADQIIEGMNTHSQATASKLLEESPIGKRLALLDVEEKDSDGKVKTQPIVFKTATRVTRSGTEALRTCYYESFGIVFYDFEANPIIDDNVEYIYPDEEYKDEEDSVAAACAAGAPGISSSNDKSAQSVYAENNTQSENSVSLSSTNTSSLEVTSSFQKTFNLTLGQEIGLHLETGDPLQNFSKWSWDFKFTFEEAWGWMWGKSNTTKKETSQGITTSLTLPPQTAAEISQETETSELNIDYNMPTAITYKVAIFSLGGHNYSDGVSFNQGSRDHSDYCAVFGSDSAEGGTYANKNLYQRVVKNINIQGYDETYGKTHGRFRNPGGTDYTYSSVLWDHMSTEQKTEAGNISKQVPMAPNGIKTSMIGTKFTSLVKTIKPIHPLYKVELSEGTADEYDMSVGDTFNLKQLKLVGKNKFGTDFYGFDPQGGSWVFCDEKGVIADKSDLVSITPFTASTGGGVLTAKQKGVQYLKWVIDKDKEYSCHSDHNPVSTDSVIYPIIKINISEEAFTGAIELKGSFTGYAGEKDVSLQDNGLKPVIKDATGLNVSRPITWQANPQEGISLDKDGNVTFTKAGTYEVRIYTNSANGCIYSDWVEIKALEARKLDSISISSDDLLKKGLETGESYDLSNVQISGKDQYGDNYNLSGCTLQWKCDDKYTSVISNSITAGDVEGTGTLTLVVNGIESNTLSIKVYKPAYIQSFTGSADEPATEGKPFNIRDISLKAKDMSGNNYRFSDSEIDSIQWALTDEGTIGANDVTLDQTNCTFTVKKGTLADGKTGTVVIEGTFVNKSGPKVKGKAEIEVKQPLFLASLNLSKNDEDETLAAGKSAFLTDLFTITGKDQYGGNYNITQTELLFESSNIDAFIIKNKADISKSVITAVNPDSSSEITVRTAKASGSQIESNTITMTVPKERTISSISFQDAPESLRLNESVNTSSFNAVCYDQEGKPFTKKDLKTFGKEISYSLDKGNTFASLNDEGVLATGSVSGEITIYAKVVDSSTGRVCLDDQGKEISVSASMHIGPIVNSISVKQENMAASGGNNSITLKGSALDDGMQVLLKDEDDTIVTKVGSIGDSETQTATVTVPENKDTFSRKYKVYYMIGNETRSPANDLYITVDFHDIVKVEATAPTCTSDGNKEYYKCTRCSLLFEDEKGNTLTDEDKITIKATGHQWDTGKVETVATAQHSGICKYTCLNDSSHTKTEFIPLLLLTANAGNRKIQLQWTRVKQADGYEIYAGKCNTDDREKTCSLKKTIKGNSNLKYVMKGLKNQRPYKVYMKAYKNINGNKVYIAKSYLVHSICNDSNKKYTNPNKIILAKTSLTLKKGKNYKISKTKITKVVKKKKLFNHEPKFRYATSDQSVATVSKNGTIKALKKGKAKIYVIAINGIRKSITVKVE